MQMTTTTDENKAVVRRLYEEIDKHNSDVFDELFAEEYTSGIYRSGSEEAVDGPAGMKNLMAEYLAAFPDFKGKSMELIAEGNRVAVFREEEGTHEGDFRGIAPTGDTTTLESAGYYVIEDGEIVHAHLHGNMLNLFKQMGVEVPIPR